VLKGLVPQKLKDDQVEERMDDGKVRVAVLEMKMKMHEVSANEESAFSFVATQKGK